MYLINVDTSMSLQRREAHKWDINTEVHYAPAIAVCSMHIPFKRLCMNKGEKLLGKAF